jgi:hypothetical protein
MMNVGESSCGELIYMDDVWGPEKVNDTCVKTMHAKMMGRGFTVFLFGNQTTKICIVWSY